MASKKDIGNEGEKLALEYLIKSGHLILESNWTANKAEIDIIYKENKTLVFVEVKTRSTIKHGFPEIAVTLKKQKLISSAAAKYIELINYEGGIRFDIISIVLKTKEDFQLQHFKDAFFFGLN